MGVPVRVIISGFLADNLNKQMSRPFVVFGYGSLIFKVNAPFNYFEILMNVQQLLASLHPMLFDKVTSFPNTLLHPNRKKILVPGFLKGYVRRFSQKSHDHRGTAEV